MGSHWRRTFQQPSNSEAGHLPFGTRQKLENARMQRRPPRRVGPRIAKIVAMIDTGNQRGACQAIEEEWTIRSSRSTTQVRVQSKLFVYTCKEKSATSSARQCDPR